MAAEDSTRVVAFWRDAGASRWFRKDPAFDDECRERFGELCRQARTGALESWREKAESALALVLLLDQLPRNIHRGSAAAWEADPLARECARDAIGRGFDQKIEKPLRGFLYMPFEHSETLADQDLAVALFTRLGDPELLHWANLHRDIILRFGRFPHRNALLGRESTAEETAWLASADSFKG